ncbi:MAG: DUF6340 family protein [Paludibacter sp.]|jgi:tetratricopeptide (TPR) repeat protein|nr:hypothetical protein [Bacteroidales bacterium]HPM09415.1 DUF6340 family protein [Paludibacter sp.]
MDHIQSFLQSIVIFLLGIFLTACSGMLFTSIDVLRPAKVNFPEDVNHLLIVNNSRPQPHTYGHTTELFDESNEAVSIETDSLALFSLASLSEAMAEKEFFSSIHLMHESIKKDSSFSEVTYPDRDYLVDLCRKEGAEGIISLNRIIVNDKLGELYDMSQALYIAYLEAIYDYNWSVHFPAKNQIYSFAAKDTVYWESESYYRERAVNGLPDRRDALIDGALISGRRSVSKFIPYWEQSDRYFFKFQDKKLKQGFDSLYVKNWDAAIDIWTDLLEKTSRKSKKIKTAHNLSVLYEIKGDIQQAYDYSNQAMDVYMDILLFDYRSILFVVQQNEFLRKRLAEMSLLNKQLGN